MSDLEEIVRKIVREEMQTGGTKRELYTVAAAATYLGVSESLVRKWIRLKQIEVVKIDGWSIRIPLPELQRKLRER